MTKENLKKIAEERNNPCVTISFNTHRTRPDNLQDDILLKKLLSEAKNEVSNNYDKRAVASLMKRIDTIAEKIDRSKNLESMHVFLSNDTEEVVRLTVPVGENVMQVADRFDVRTWIKYLNRANEYYILLLSQGGVSLYQAVNDKIENEVENKDFPFAANPHIVTENVKRSDNVLMDNMVREYYNKVDKALIKLYNEDQKPCVVICTESNYSQLLYVADRPQVYIGYENINYNDTSLHKLGKQGWDKMQEYQYSKRTKAIEEMEKAISHGNVITDLQEIYRAAVDGKGELLVVSDDFSQPVLITGEKTFDVIFDKDVPNAIDDITGTIAWEVLSKGGRVFFTSQEKLKAIGDIALKVRF